MTLGDSERQQILCEWNQTEAEFPRDKCIHQMFEEQVARSPDAIALVFENDCISYSELNRRSNQLAHHLTSLGVRADARVAICAERSLEMVVALLAVIKAGGAYVPLDPSYPPDRLGYMLEDSAPVALLDPEPSRWGVREQELYRTDSGSDRCDASLARSARDESECRRQRPASRQPGLRDLHLRLDGQAERGDD